MLPRISGPQTMLAVCGGCPPEPPVVVSPGAKPGDDAALIRIVRVAESLPGAAIIEAVTAGVLSVQSIDRSAQPMRILVR